MELSKLLNIMTKVFCTLVAIVLITWQVIAYITSDDDLVQVDFKRFHSSDDRTYPALTLCFHNTSIYKNLETTPTFPKNVGSYKNASSCTSPRIQDYIKSITVTDFENTITQYTKYIDGVFMIEDEARYDQLATSFFLRLLKERTCFAIGVPFVKQKEIKSMRIQIRKSIFSSTNTPRSCLNINKWSKVSVGLQYRNQFFPLLNGKEMLDTKEFNSSPGFVFHVSGMEIINRRNKHNDPCNIYAKGQAIKGLEDLADGFGCKPPNIDSTTSFSDCFKKTLAMYTKHIDNGLHDSKSNFFHKPCRYIQNLWHRWSIEDNSLSTKNDTLSMTVVYNRFPFKEITFVPAASLPNLVMNIMAIIGFILGTSIYNILNLISNQITRGQSRPTTELNNQFSSNVTNGKAEVTKLIESSLPQAPKDSFNSYPFNS